MKYTARKIEGNVNITNSPPLKELFLLLGGLLGILIAVYVVLGFAVDMIVMKLPPDLEHHLSGFFSSAFTESEHIPADDYLQELLDTLVEHSSLPSGDYQVHLVLSSEANALALPGGHIIVLSGLIDELEFENELSFILAHELGHFANRDHLKGLGRGLVLIAMSALLVGADNGLTQFLMGSLMNVEMRFSQQQETAADLYGLELLNASYGHVGGATDFFEKLAQEERHGRLAYFFATHPYPRTRVADLQDQVREKGYHEQAKQAFDPRIDSIPEAAEAKTFKDIFRPYDEYYFIAEK